jgi:hypothetical protein
MNERIRELVREAGLDNPDFPIEDWDNVPLEKFAMSIIKECLGQVEGQYKSILQDEVMMKDIRWVYYVDCGFDTDAAIREHFGVSDERTN